MWETLARFAAGECTPAEEAELRAWAESDPTHAELLRSVQTTWDATTSERRRASTEAAWERVRERMAASAPATTPRLRPMMRGLFRTSLPARRAAWRGSGAWPGGWALATAASVLVALVSGGVSLALLADRRVEPVAVQELITNKGERAEARLSDGTRVVLGPETRIRIDYSGDRGRRAVQLLGEAYFDVAADPDRPFEVRAGNTVTRVLGTEFDVRAYPADSSVNVVVAEGRVAFRDASAPDSTATQLEPGDLGTLVTGGTVSVRRVDPDAYLGWQNGRLAFEDAPLSQVAAQIERWYGIPVRIGDPTLSNRRLTASFRDQSLDEVIANIAAALELKYTKVGQSYTFLPKDRLSSLARS